MSDISRLKSLKKNIENMSKTHQLEVLRILVKSDVNVNENSNGVFVNLSDLNEETLTSLNNYTKYVSEQQRELNNIEQQKEHIENVFFKDNKDIESNTVIACDEE